MAVGVLSAGPALWAAIPSEPASPSLVSLRLMTININADNLNAAAIDREVRAADPDILVMQEFRSIHESLFKSTLQERYPYLRSSTPNAGVAIYSKGPVMVSTADQFLGMEDPGRARYEVELGGKTVALYVVHVPRFDSINSFRRSRIELARLMAFITTDPLPVIVAGDFNFTDQTPNAAALRDLRLRSCYDLAGGGFGGTRPVDAPVLKHCFGFRIDHVFVRAPITCSKYYVGGPVGSDHLPVVVDLGLQAPSDGKPIDR
jgi:endonuclease/exonuclease/phosphatase (EEP) superfamily protein YafD